MGKTFENQDLSGAVFSCVNLRHAVFNDVNLEKASIRNVNLANASIEDANIMGMTVFGFRIDELIEAELDRRDPERAQLRMDDPYDPTSVRRVMEMLEQRRDVFRATLRSAPPDHLCKRPAKGRWSAIEHTRHLVFAEDLYTNRWILRNDEPWTRLGLLPAFLAKRAPFADVGSEPCDDIETVLSAWDAIHARTQEFVRTVTAAGLRRDTSDIDFGQGTVGGILQGMVVHDLHHIRKAEAALSAAKSESAT
jgi:hypothetical protein